MAPKFGTSGLRGLVTELTDDLVTAHVVAFLRCCDTGTAVFVGRDLRASSPGLAGVVTAALRSQGVAVVDCGAVPTPALALAAMAQGAAAIMVTGSHIPADRNGLKFYLPGGEITKADEARIVGALWQGDLGSGGATGAGSLRQDMQAGPRWVARYVSAFGAGALAGSRIGVWSHSAVSRDLLVQALQALGATVTQFDRSEHFVPVDTEALPERTRADIAAWVQAQGLEALVSTDGDGDRPLLADGNGVVVPGDILGQITARVVGADSIVTPVTSNSGAEAGRPPLEVLRTKVGSPHVIAGMAQTGGRVVGYEANGGFLLGFEARLAAGPLPALATRDSLLPILATLVAGRAAGGIAALVAAQPPRFTAADRLEGAATDRSAALIAALAQDAQALHGFLAGLGESPAALDQTDGLRISLASGRVLHLRPSGNAPELRVYAEAETPATAARLLAAALALAAARLD